MNYIFSIKSKLNITSSQSGSALLAADKYDFALECCPERVANTARLFNAAPCDPSELMHRRRHRRAKLKSPVVYKD